MLRRLLSTTHRPRIAGVAGIACCAVLVTITSSTWAAWSDATSNAANHLEAAADWVAPTITASTVALTNGKSVGTVGRNSTYYVYANATEAGNPPSGVTTLTANVDVLTASASNVALTAGSYSVGGTAYGWRSAALTAGGSLADGAYTYTHQSGDAAGNTRNQTGFPVSVDATAPTAADVQATNTAGGAAGVPEQGDTIVYTFSEPVDPASISPGWDGSTRNISVVGVGTGTGPPANTRSNWTLYETDGVTQLPMGTVIGHAHIKRNSTVTFGPAGTPSTIAVSGATVTVTLGTPSSADTSAATAAFELNWTPTAAVTDLVGNAGSTAPRAETGASDIDF